MECQSLSGDEHDAAEDFAQETLLTVWRKAAYFDPARASASAWIFTIARNLRIDRLRGDNRAKLYAPYEMVEPEGPENPDSALNAAERDARVRAALKELSQEQVRVVQLSFFEGRAHGDIATLLDLPLGTLGAADLALWPVITDRAGTHLHAAAMDWFRIEGVEPARHHGCSSLPTRIQLAVRGVGVALASPSAASRPTACWATG